MTFVESFESTLEGCLLTMPDRRIVTHVQSQADSLLAALHPCSQAYNS